MFSAKSSKRTMTASVISLVLCFVMLLGTTFAWFTTNASTSVNTIKSGSLSVDLVDAKEESLVGKTVAFKNADSETLWEPGCTYELEEVYVKNTGKLALKYNIEVVGVDGDAKLLDAIDWTISVDNTNNVLAAGATSAAIAIKGTMKKDAGNQYQDLEADGIAITVTATQAAVESDSIDDQYDKDAAFAAVSAVVTELGEEKPADLAVAYKFKPAEDASKSAYKDYKADFVVSFDKDIPANAVTLKGQYGDYDWTAISNPVALAAGEEIRLLETMLNTSVTYEEICSFGEFNCGAASNGASGVNMTVELRLYDANGDYLIAGTYTYAF